MHVFFDIHLAIQYTNFSAFTNLIGVQQIYLAVYFMPFYKKKKLTYISMSIDIYLQCIILANLPASGGRRPPKFVRPQQSLFARIFCRILPIFSTFYASPPNPQFALRPPNFAPQRLASMSACTGWGII